MTAVGVIPAAAAFVLAAAAPVRWDALRQAWDRFYEHPSAERAGAVARDLPVERARIGTDGPDAQAREEIFDNLDPLAAILEADPKTASELGFSLYAIADPDGARSLDILLATLIAKHPALFLEALRSRRALVPDVESLVSAIGDPDEIEDLGPKAVLRERMRALESVKEPKLAAVREECLRALRRSDPR
jgi:hypothetical protein